MLGSFHGFELGSSVKGRWPFDDLKNKMFSAEAAAAAAVRTTNHV